ncbi:transglycosylase domain-containing protein [Microaerobacter geothermalis]|uniref:transglycosylase domain-containing protein n=1 Tax=Microaerobacter geothermalis TaxID=674972 RepID=UPI0022A6A0EF|nr:transglycosylase domain-containing protein [Microaerobacter geothermalis]
MVREPRIIRLIRLVIKSFRFLFIVSVLSFAALTLFIIYLQSQPLPKSSIPETTTIHDMNGNVIDTIFTGENRKSISLSEISPLLIKATISIEDRKFYDHFGFDLKRTAKAILVDLQHMEKLQGGSTISQQLAKNLFLTSQKTWERKIKEAVYTIQLELNYTKDEILEAYLNQIYYGHSAYGIEAAAQTFFGKSAKDLNLAESSMLAGIPKGPAFYSPFLDYRAAKERQQIVLQAMVNEGYISQKEAEEAFQEPLQFTKKNERVRPNDAPYFTDYIVQQLKDIYGFSEKDIKQGGLHVYTTLDLTLQKAAENAMETYLPKDRPLQAALIAVEPSTGEIKAMIGGNDYETTQFNRVFAKRQPGSSFKPIVYLAALQNGFTPVTLMKSEPTVFTYDKEKVYAPENFGGKYPNDFITLQRAIAQSDNIYAVKTHMLIGPETTIEMAKKLGITTPLKPLPSLALGSAAVSPYEMATVYSTLANGGERIQPWAIKKITNRNGTVLVENKPIGERVVDEATAFVLTSMLQTVFAEGGTGYSIAGQLNRPVAGKTGTTDYDAWLSGYTPQLEATVWIGYDMGRQLNPVNDGTLVKKIWGQFMADALAGQPPEIFPVPSGVTSAYVNPDDGLLATESCPKQVLMYFLPGTEPTEYCKLHLKDGEENNTSSPEQKSFWDKIRNWWKNEDSPDT